jgi:hypothetical protein
MAEVVVAPLVHAKLDILEQLLYEREYFGFLESAEEYVNSIADFILTIPKLMHHKTINPFYGAYYVKYQVKNKRTLYYITFDKKEKRYLIKNIITSHKADYPKYIKG